MSEPLIPLAEPFLKGRELEYLEECIQSNFVSSVGPFVGRLEEAFAHRVGTRYAVACASGTAALHVAMRLLGVGSGDEVVVPSFTFIASANAVAYQGGRPVFVDSEPQTWNLDPDLVVREIERRDRRGLPLPKAIEVVHVLGHPANIEPIIEVGDRFSIPVVEDAAESLGASYRVGWHAGKQVGTLGRIGCYSFNGNKVMTTGGGGMVVTDDGDLARRAKHLTTQARLPGPAYDHDEIGYNYRLSNISAAIGVAQLEQLDHFVLRKREIAERYDEAFRGIEHLTLPPDQAWAQRSAWLYSIRLSTPGLATIVLAELNAAGIAARPVWQPLHRLEPYRDADLLGTGREAEAISATAISLPSSVALSRSDQDRVIGVVVSAIERVGPG